MIENIIGIVGLLLLFSISGGPVLFVFIWSFYMMVVEDRIKQYKRR